ncbi:unnamed protein product, partial [Trichogramma brassicae]
LLLGLFTCFYVTSFARTFLWNILTHPSSRQISVIAIGYIKLRPMDWLHLDEIHSYSSSRPLQRTYDGSPARLFRKLARAWMYRGQAPKVKLPRRRWPRDGCSRRRRLSYIEIRTVTALLGFLSLYYSARQAIQRYVRTHTLHVGERCHSFGRYTTATTTTTTTTTSGTQQKEKLIVLVSGYIVFGRKMKRLTKRCGRKDLYSARCDEINESPSQKSCSLVEHELTETSTRRSLCGWLLAATRVACMIARAQMGNIAPENVAAIDSSSSDYTTPRPQQQQQQQFKFIAAQSTWSSSSSFTSIVE